MPRRALTFPNTVDPSRVVNGSYQFDNGEVMDFDAQILALETFALANQNRGQVTATMTLDAGSATTAVGDLLCLGSSSAAVTVTRATATPLTAAGNMICAIALQAIAPGLPILVALPGSLIPPSITGLTTGPKYVTANTSTARYTVAASYGGTDVVVGITDTANNLAFEPIAKGVAGGGGGTLAGDATGAAGANTVVNLTGSAGVVTVAATTLSYTETLTPVITQAIRTSDAATHDLTITAQAPFASATGTNRNSGNLTLGTAAPVAGGTSGKIQLAPGGSTVGTFSSSGTFATTAAATFSSGAGDCVLQTSNSVLITLAFASGNITLSGTPFVIFTNNVGGGNGVEFVPTYNGAAKVRFGNLVTSGAFTIADNTVNSTTGVVLSILGQNSTGTTATGGDTEIGPGTGTTANGKLNLKNIITGTTVGAAGGASALPATPTGYLNIKVNGTAQRVPYYA